MFNCRFCNKECKNANSLRNHERLCKMNPNRQIIKSNFIEYNKKVLLGEIKKEYSNQYTKASKLGLPKPQISDETRRKISESSSKRTKTDEQKQRLSESMRLAVINNPQSYCSSNVNGRVKKVKYQDRWFDSKWEVIVAKYLDDLNIKWDREVTGIEYEYEGKKHLYFPDFYLPEYDKYIEVKGYERKRDLYKYSCLNNLIILKKDEIHNIIKNNFDIKQYIFC